MTVDHQVSFDRRGYLDRRDRVTWRVMGDRQRGDESLTISFPLDSKHDDAGPVLTALFLTGLMLAVRKIGIGDNEAGFRVWYRRAA